MIPVWLISALHIVSVISAAAILVCLVVAAWIERAGEGSETGE